MYTHNEKLNIQDYTLMQKWFRNQVDLPKGWSIDHRHNEVVYRNLTETLRYDLGIWVSDSGVATISSLKQRCAEIIERSKADVIDADKAQDEKYTK
ncbi:MAG: hypothetical protein VX423_05260 [Pseudomonadota bacterium]|nr:hypothetical protein [Pseudomonadota bacterium]